MNRIKTLGLSCLALGTAAALGGCVDDYGYGYGGGIAVGYGAPGYDGWYDGYYGAYGDPGFGYGYPGYFGWYNGFYYPGTGFYVYDRFHHPYRWNGDQRHYWEGQRNAYGHGPGGPGFHPGTNWGGFNHGAGGGARPTGQAFRGGGGFHGGGGGFHGGGHR